MAKFLGLALCLLTPEGAASVEQQVEGSLTDALAEDDQCLSTDASSEKCSLSMLQMRGAAARTAAAEKANATAAADSSDSTSINPGEILRDALISRGSSWNTWNPNRYFISNERETHHTCVLYHCHEELGPTDCVMGRCVCKRGYQWNDQSNRCESKEAPQDTGGSCWFYPCAFTRGPTECVKHRCMCLKGYIAVEGKCVKAEEPEEPETTTTTTLEPDPLPTMHTNCGKKNARCGSDSCCEGGLFCDGSSRCREVTEDTEVPRYNFVSSLYKESEAPLHTFYVYRAQGETSYPLENVNAASLGGVMWYLHNEVVGRGDWGGKRKFEITRILRYKVHYKAPQTLYSAGMNFGVRFAFDSGQCTGPFSCDAAWRNYGYFLGCNKLKSGFPFPDIPVAYDGTWYSIPGKCPQMKYFQKTKEGHKGMDCLENQPGGYCSGIPTGEADCTYNYEAAGEISLDELTGIPDYAQFISNGGLEYDKNTDRGKKMSFWNGIMDPQANARRVKAVEALFEKHYPRSTTNMAEPPCDFDFDTFYQKNQAVPGGAGSGNVVVDGPNCHTAQPGEQCYQQVSWARSDGIHGHPDWYPSLTPQSTFEEFQQVLSASGNSDCQAPCMASDQVPAADEPAAAAPAEEEPPAEVPTDAPPPPAEAPTPAPVAQEATPDGPPPAPPPAGCKTLAIGDPCWREVMWARNDGIHAHPEWYPGLSAANSMDDFQYVLSFTRPQVCSPPCTR